jgi:hypothetical protein
MSFQSNGSSTTAGNAQQQAATFWQDASGLTTVARDFAGSVTALGLSDTREPIAVQVGEVSDRRRCTFMMYSFGVPGLSVSGADRIAPIGRHRVPIAYGNGPADTANGNATRSGQ